MYYSILLDLLGHDRIEELPLSIPSTDIPDGFSFRLVKTTYVKLAINNLLNSENAGGDSITFRMIKISSPAIIMHFYVSSTHRSYVACSNST